MRKLIPALVVTLVVILAVAACSSGSGLTGKTWQLTATTTKVPASQGVVPDPQNYTIEFKPEGTSGAKADCNQSQGTYTTSGSNLTITLGSSTLAQCGPESLSDQYLTGLADAASYAIAGDRLTITTKDEATMTFR